MALKTLPAGALATAILFGAPAMAPAQDFTAYDTSGDGFIDQSEAESANQLLENSDLTESQSLERETLLSARLEFGPPPWSLAQLIALAQGARQQDCTDIGPIIIRQQIVGEGFFGCVPRGQGAVFTLERDEDADTTFLVANGGIGIPFPRQPIGFPNQTDRLGTVGFVAFAQATDVLLSPEGPDKGLLRFGVQSEIQAVVDGAGDGKWSLDALIAPYYLTDPNFNASGYGVEVSFIPYDADLRLNTKRKPDPFFWTANAGLDYRWVNTGGVTGFENGDEAAWLFSNFGFKYQSGLLWHGIEFGLSGSYAYDMIQGQDLSAGDVNATIALNEARTIGLTVGYTIGESRDNPEFQSKLKTALSVRF